MSRKWMILLYVIFLYFAYVKRFTLSTCDDIDQHIHVGPALGIT